MSAQADPSPLRAARAELIRLGGGYLRNVRWGDTVTCAFCAGVPNGDFSTCYNCESWSRRTDLLDRVGFATYAIDQTQSAWTMYGYKNPQPSQSNAYVVRLLHHYGLAAHWRCIVSSPLGQVTHWSSVPSLRGREGLHPLRAMGADLFRSNDLPLVDLVPAADVVVTRELRAANFAVPDPAAVSGAHVLLIEDAWVGGGRTQSAAAALKLAGARAVTAFVLARWLTPGRGHTNQLLQRLPADYDPDVCPFDSTACLNATR